VAKEKRPEAYSAILCKIGARIKWARELVEPNRAAMARIMGIDKSTLQKIEDGDRAPSIFNVLDLSHRLRVTPDYILRGTLTGIDGELAGLLVSLHPELAPGSRTATDCDTRTPPKKPKRA
jgi:transcriptional regulator with XRE-family HTH domain